jgi:hypothetical protein
MRRNGDRLRSRWQGVRGAGIADRAGGADRVRHANLRTGCQPAIGKVPRSGTGPPPTWPAATTRSTTAEPSPIAREVRATPWCSDGDRASEHGAALRDTHRHAGRIRWPF